MPRLHATAALDHADVRVASDPSAWLPEPARPAGPDAWVVEMHLGRLHRSVYLHVGPAWHDGAEVRRTVRWQTRLEDGDVLPLEAVLPPFSGAIVATPTGLDLEGTYAPPASALGRTADLLLRHLATRTVQNLLREIAARAARLPQGA